MYIHYTAKLFSIIFYLNGQYESVCIVHGTLLKYLLMADFIKKMNTWKTFAIYFSQFLGFFSCCPSTPVWIWFSYFILFFFFCFFHNYLLQIPLTTWESLAAECSINYISKQTFYSFGDNLWNRNLWLKLLPSQLLQNNSNMSRQIAIFPIVRLFIF